MLDKDIQFILKIQDYVSKPVNELGKDLDVLQKEVAQFNALKIKLGGIDALEKQLQDVKASMNAAAVAGDSMLKGSLKADANKLSKQIEVLKHIDTGMHQFSADLAMAADQAKKGAYSIDYLKNKIEALHKQRNASWLPKEQKDLNASIKYHQEQLNKAQGSDKPKGLLGNNIFMKGGAIALSTLSLGAAKDFALDITNTTAKYEKFEAVLKNTFQSGTKAKDSMAELTSFAASTPFQIDELTDSYVKLVNRGFTPTMDEMRNLGDLASSTGKDFKQLTEAVLDAETGEFERLKEFGIKASKEGNKLKMGFGDKTPVLIDNNAKAIRAYILSLGTLAGVQGSSNAIMKTSGGMISNLADSWDQLKLAIGQANSGIIHSAIAGLNGMVSAAKEWFSIPLSQSILSEQGAINAMVHTITDSNLSYEERIKLMGDLQAQYPDFFKNLDKENATNEDLLRTLDKVNEAYKNRYGTQKYTELAQKNQATIDELTARKEKKRFSAKLTEEARQGSEAANKALADFVEQDKWSGLSDFFSGKMFESNAEIDKQIKEATHNRDLAQNQVFKEKLNAWQMDIAAKSNDKLSPKQATMLQEWMSQLTKRRGEFDKLSVEDPRFSSLKKTIEQYQSNINGLWKPGSDSKKEGTGFPYSGINDINTGGKNIKNINVNVAKFQDNLIINEQNITQDPAKLATMIQDELLRVVNAANSIQ